MRGPSTACPPRSEDYRTLRGSGTLVQATAQGTVYTVGSSGFLFRSNKLMYESGFAAATPFWGEASEGAVAAPPI
jgi:hypothetical protein